MAGGDGDGDGDMDPIDAVVSPIDGDDVSGLLVSIVGAVATFVSTLDVAVVTVGVFMANPFTACCATVAAFVELPDDDDADAGGKPKSSSLPSLSP